METVLKQTLGVAAVFYLRVSDSVWKQIGLKKTDWFVQIQQTDSQFSSLICESVWPNEQ